MKTNAVASSLVRSRCDRRVVWSLVIACTLSACNHQSPADYKTAVIGDWEEVHGTRETLHFKADGSLAMDSPLQHRSCTYDFPDTKHIRLNCASFAPQAPHVPTTYGFALVNDQVLISDALSTGTYKRTATTP